MKKPIKIKPKLLIAGLLIAIVLISTVFGTQGKPSIDVVFNSINIKVQGEALNIENFIYKDTSYVAIRPVAESLNKKVGWDGETKTVTIDDMDPKSLSSPPEKGLESNREILKGKKTIDVVFNALKIKRNSRLVNTDTILYNGRSYLPIRSLAKVLAMEVEWIEASRTVVINDLNPHKTRDLKIHYIDVGQGDSILLQLPQGENVLIDGGSKSKTDTLMDYLKGAEVGRIDYLIATHPHEDHIGGLVEVIKSIPIGEIYMPDKAHTTQVFEDLLLAIRDKGYGINKSFAGQIILDEDLLKMEVLAPERDLTTSNTNNYSVVLKVTYGDTSFLFTGDAEKEAENTMLEMNYDLKSDLLKAGHHGSNTSSTDAFLDRVKPKYVVISSGLDNKYGHPDPEIIESLESRNIAIFRTDIHGSIIASSDGKSIVIIKEK